MFRKIVSTVTLAAMFLSTIGCTKMHRVPAEQAVGNKAPVSRAKSARINTLDLTDGTTVIFDTSGAEYSAENGFFEGRLPDGGTRRVFGKSVRYLSLRVGENCDKHEVLTDMQTYLKTVMNQSAALPLSVNGHTVRELELRDGTRVKTDKAGLFLNCSEFAWFGRTSNGDSVSVKSEDIAAYKYRGLNKLTVGLIIVGLVAGILAATADWDWDMSVSPSF